MKKLLTIICVLFMAITVNAQDPKTFSLNVYGGYTFPERVKFDAFYTDVKAGFQYGGELEYIVMRNQSIQLKYMRMDTEFPLYTINGNHVTTGNEKGALNYILIGGNSYFPKTASQKAVPYLGGDLGVGIIEGPGSSTKFAFDIQAGVKIKTSSMISFKLQAYLQSIISTFGNDYWLGYYGGVYAVPDYASILQFGLGGAICFDFKKK